MPLKSDLTRPVHFKFKVSLHVDASMCAMPITFKIQIPNCNFPFDFRLINSLVDKDLNYPLYFVFRLKCLPNLDCNVPLHFGSHISFTCRLVLAHSVSGF